jgi:hypothetical protein
LPFIAIQENRDLPGHIRLETQGRLRKWMGKGMGNEKEARKGEGKKGILEYPRIKD